MNNARTSAGLLLAAALLPVAANAADSNSATALNAPQNAVCVSVGADSVVSQSALANWMNGAAGLRIDLTRAPDKMVDGVSVPQFYDPLAVISGQDLDGYLAHLRSLADSAPATQKQRDDMKAEIVALQVSVNAMGQLQRNADIAYFGNAGGDFDGTAWLRQPGLQGPLKISCNLDYAKKQAKDAEGGATPLFDISRFRVRGTPDSLAVGRDVDSGDVHDATFGGADKASLSYSYNGTKKSRSDVMQLTLGYAVDLGPFTLVPYGAVNRTFSSTKGSPDKVDPNYYDFGGVLGYRFHNADWGGLIAAQPHYLVNDLDKSRQFGLHFEGTPILAALPVNNYIVWGDGKGGQSAAFAFLFDLRGDAVTFTERGSAPATNLDYFRFGTRFGATATIKPLQSDITVTDTWMYGASGTLRNLNDFQASWTVHFDPDAKYFGLSLVYKSGRIEASSDKEQSWLIALTGKY